MLFLWCKKHYGWLQGIVLTVTVPFWCDGLDLWWCLEVGKKLIVILLFSGLYRDVQSLCLSVTWRAEDKKQQVLDGKVRGYTFWCRTSVIFCLPPASRRVLMQGQECFTFLVRFKISNTLVPKVDCSVGFFTSLFSSRRTKEIVWGQCNFSKYSFLLPNLFFRLKSQTA